MPPLRHRLFGRAASSRRVRSTVPGGLGPSSPNRPHPLAIVCGELHQVRIHPFLMNDSALGPLYSEVARRTINGEPCVQCRGVENELKHRPFATEVIMHDRGCSRRGPNVYEQTYFMLRPHTREPERADAVLKPRR